MSNVTDINEYRTREKGESAEVRRELAALPFPRAEHLAQLPGFLDGVLTLVVDHGMSLEEGVELALAVGLDTWIDRYSWKRDELEHASQLNATLRGQLAAAHLLLDHYRATVPMYPTRKIEVNR